MRNINTDKYWDFRFENNWEKMRGFEQTEFFARSALQLMPKWLFEEIQKQKLTICDFGCAAGQAVDVFHKTFDTEVSGVDFSEKAVSLAREIYPDYKFYQSDIVDEYMEGFRVDAGYMSNVLEHFERPWMAAEMIARYVKQYLMILVPFRETMEIEEHCYIFDTSNIPLKLGEMNLIHADYMNCVEISENLYGGLQMLLIYSRKACRDGIGCMSDLVDSFEQNKKELEAQVDSLEQNSKKLEAQIDFLEQNRKRLETQIAEAENKYKEYRHRMKNEAEEAVRCINIVQSGRIYRSSLAVKRFFIQCIHTRDRRDFFRWFLSRMLRKNTDAKALREFDSLEQAKDPLKKAMYRQCMDEIEETRLIRLKKTRRVVIFASVPFYDVGGGQRSAQLARTFNAMGYQVFYIYGFPCTEDQALDMLIPVNEHEYIDNIHNEWFAGLADSSTIVIFEIPYYKFEPYLDMAKHAGSMTVYEHIDNWDTSLGCLFYNADVFQRFLLKADIVTVTAKKLGEKIEEFCSREYLYLPNAVNVEIFEPLRKYTCPADLKRGKKTLLYFGSLWGEWFEWDKIEMIAGRCPECEINLIGDYSGCMDHVEKKTKNIHFLGAKAQTELPGYLKYTDYALLPFKKSAIGAYVSPLKIFEYIAMNVQVLATALDDIQGYPNVYCSDSADEWIKVINGDMETPVDCTAFISKNNWFARCAEIIERSNQNHVDMPSISVIVLNYNNRKVIGRCVDTLLAHNRRYGCEIIVVDNGSTDGSYEFLADTYQDQIVLLRNKKNGCSSGRNLGAGRSNGEYLCFLDSDQWAVNDYWLDSALEIFQTDPQIGAVGWAAGWFSNGRAAGPIVDAMPNRAIDSAGIWYRTDIAYLGTGGLVMKKKIFEKTEGFDEYYDPTCFEDTDLSLQIRDAGYELAYCPYIGIMHLPHQTTHSGSRQHAKLMKRNEAYFMEKWKQRQPNLLEYYLIM